MKFILSLFFGLYLITTGICQNNSNIISLGSKVYIPSGYIFTEVKHEILDTINNGFISGKASFNINYLKESYVTKIVKYSTSINEILTILKNERILLVEYERSNKDSLETALYFSIRDNIQMGYKELNIIWTINE
jgi:hypothetical protein